MGWDVDKLRYIYKIGTLRAIAKCYCSLYNQEYFHPQADLFAIAEYKADFDLALSAIGKGHWVGLENTDFRAYRYFGRMQQVIIADILGITDWELRQLGFYKLSQLRRQAYTQMANFLNGYQVEFKASGFDRHDIIR